MNILISGENLENYYAKVHEAFRTGLVRCFNAKTWGKGYEGYDNNITSYKQIVEKTFGNTEIDLIVLHDNWDMYKNKLEYEDLDKLKCKKAFILGDFWSEAEVDRKQFFDFINYHKIDFILSYFRKPFQLWSGTDIFNKLIWLPPCFDPTIFNDWNMKKIWDVGNLNAGIFEENSFYPERHDMHMKLLNMKDINYFYTKHPGYGFHTNTSLIGKSFSEAINSCKIFVTSGNSIYKNFNSKYIETLASGTCLLATSCFEENQIGLIDGYNYIKITSNNFEDKIRYYIKHEEERNIVAKNGYFFAMQNYTCYSAAVNVVKQIFNKEKRLDNWW